MLVLQRKTGQDLRIDGEIVIRILGVSRGRVRLGIEASPRIPVVRAEAAAPGTRGCKPTEERHPDLAAAASNWVGPFALMARRADA